MRSSSPLKLRAAALAAAATLALGASACGGSDGDDGDDGDDAATPAEDRQQARATVNRLYDAIAANDAEEVCAQLNEDAQRQLAEGGLGAKGKSCADSFQKFLDQAEEAGGLDLTLKADVKRVEVTGDTAVAHVTFGGQGPDGEIPLEKVDGEWKLEAAGATPSN